MDGQLLRSDACKCGKQNNWKKIILKVSFKIIISGLIKALITHIVLSHMRKL